MRIVRWSREQVVGRAGDLVLDELDDAAVLVIDDVSADDDLLLEWCRHAPCVVVAVSQDAGPRHVDVVVAADELDRLDPVLAAVEAQPQSARILVDVLRVVPELGVAEGLVVESLAYSLLLASEPFRRWASRRPRREPKEFDGPPVRVERAGTTLTVTLARPQNRNAFSAEMRDSLHDALLGASADASLDTVELRADGPSFSSGGDLTEFGTADDHVRSHEVRTLHGVGRLIARDARRVTAYVHGPCVGAGVEIPAFAGRVVATEDATFRLPEVAMGLIPGAGGTVSITRRIGRQRTAELALSGRAVDASEARSIGLVDEVVARD